MAWAGERKSGSPDDRPTIFTPCARTSRTLRVIAADADTLTDFKRSAGSNIALPTPSLRPLFAERTIEKVSAESQPRGGDTRHADRLVLLAGAARGAGGADDGAVLVLDHYRAGLRNELDGGQG